METACKILNHNACHHRLKTFKTPSHTERVTDRIPKSPRQTTCQVVQMERCVSKEWKEEKGGNSIVSQSTRDWESFPQMGRNVTM